MSSHALLGGRRFTALFLALDCFCLLFQDNPHGVGEEAIHMSSWGWAPSSHCFSAWQTDFENGFVKSSFLLLWMSHHFCLLIIYVHDTGIEAFAFRLLQSLSISWPHWEGLLLLLPCPLHVCKCFHCLWGCALCSPLVSGFEAGAGSVRFVFGKRHRPLC